MFTDKDKVYMRRCFTLALLGQGKVKSNPIVGSVVVYQDQIISEGYHAYYGGLHAERMALLNVPSDKEHLLPLSTLYVSLEPCNHHGKTPPCTEIIINKKINRVIICQEDPNPLMQGKSIEYLRANGINTEAGLLKEEGQYLIKKFIINQNEKIPFITIKVAKSSHGYIGKSDEQIWLSNEESRLYSHKLRADVDAIMVGTNTAIIDNPKLNNRYFTGRNPIRVVIDRLGQIPHTHHLLSDELETIIYTTQEDYKIVKEHKTIVKLPNQERFSLIEIFSHLYQRGISSLLIEGGAQLLQNVVSEQLWHEAYIIETDHPLNEGIKAPVVKGKMAKTYQLNTNKVLKINALKMNDFVI